MSRVPDDILLVVVNYFNDREVTDFTTAVLANQDFTRFRVLVVNNGSKDATALSGSLKNDRVILLEPGKNLGYLHAFLFACVHYSGLYGGLPALCILSNSDIHIVSPQALTALSVKYNTVNFACMGPRIFSITQQIDQNPFEQNRVTVQKLKRVNFFQSNYLLYLVYQSAFLLKNKVVRITKSNEKSENARDVYAVHGAFMVFNADFIQAAIPVLSKAPFLFGEELYVAETARKLGMRIIYDPSVTIEHREHATTSTYKNPGLVHLLHKSTSMILEHFFNTSKSNS